MYGRASQPPGDHHRSGRPARPAGELIGPAADPMRGFAMGRPAPPDGGLYGEPSGQGVRRLGAGIGLGLVLLILGFLARTGSGTRLDLAVDRALAHTRVGALTMLAKAATAVAAPGVGVFCAVAVPVLLFLLRRRGLALRVFCVLVCALAVSYVAKYVVSERRPLSSLWAVQPDSKWSFPSGHTTVACALVVAALLIVPVAARLATGIAGALFVLLVAWSRVYLGVHYPLDTIGAMVATGCAVLCLAGLGKLPPGRRWLVVLDNQGRRKRS